MHRIEDVALPPEGELLAVEVDGTKVAVAVVEGAVVAVDDACTHMACSLSDGEVEGGEVVCPCHFGRFDLRTGAVRGGPPTDPVRTWRATYLEADRALELEP